MTKKNKENSWDYWLYLILQKPHISINMILKYIKSVYRFINPKFQTIFLEYRVKQKPRYGHGKPAHDTLQEQINTDRETYIETLKKVLKYKDTFLSIKYSKAEQDETEPVWDNKYFPGLDIITLYTQIVELKPKRYIEVGSGTSTKVVYKAIKENNLQTQITSIDPYPRSEIDSLSDNIIRVPFEKINLDIVSELEAGDILFIDNSHRILPNSDSMVFFLEILPNLKKGVIVHIHDIYLPFDYPQFMCDRFYSEQYGLAIALLSNPKRYQTILPNYFISEDKELAKIIDPIWNNDQLKHVEQHGCSYWIKINE